MKGTLGPPSSNREQVILIAIFLGAAVLIFALFTQQKLLFYLIGLGIMGIIGWAQFNLKRWIYLLIIFIPFSPSTPISELLKGVTIELSDFGILAVFLIFLMNVIVAPRGGKRNDQYLLMPLLLYMVPAIFACFWGFFRHQRYFLILNSLGHLLKWISYVSIYFIIFRVFNQDKDLKNLLRIILISFAIGSLVSVYYYLVYSPELAAQGRLYRTSGIVEGGNGYGVILALVLIFYFNLFLQGKIKELFPRWLFFTLWSMVTIALILTFSRTAWAGLWLGMFGLSIFRRRRYIAVILIVLAFLNFFLLRSPVEKRIKATFEKQPWSTLPVDMGGRENIWKRAMERIGFKNILGVGYFNFSYCLMGTTPHNQYIALLGETGIFGLIFFMIWIFRLFRVHFYLARHHPIPFYRECAIGNMVGLFILCFVSMTGEYFFMAYGMLIFLSLYACSRLTYQMEYEKFLRRQAYPPKVPFQYGYGLPR